MQAGASKLIYSYGVSVSKQWVSLQFGVANEASQEHDRCVLARSTALFVLLRITTQDRLSLEVPQRL